MQITTRFFGDIEIDDQKILHFEEGLIGFENLKKFTLIYNSEGESSKSIIWLQSLDEPMVAFPMINPFHVMADYNPVINDEVLDSLGELREENTALFLTLTVPSDISKMTTNLKAPIVVNADTKRGCQVIAENPEYVIKYNIYDVIQKMKEDCKDEEVH